MQIPVRIPCKPHIRKFILHYAFQEDPIPLTGESMPAILLMGLLKKNQNVFDNSLLMKRYTSEVKFLIGERYRKWLGAGITKTNIIIYNRMMDHLFRHEIFYMSETYLANGNSVRDTIMDFRAKMGLTEEDFSYDAFRQTIYRYRVEVGDQKKKFRNISA